MQMRSILSLSSFSSRLRLMDAVFLVMAVSSLLCDR